MIRRSSLAIFLFLSILGAYQNAGGATFRQTTPYFLKANRLFLGLEYENAGLNGATLNRFEFNMDYGINENVLAGVMLPYLSIYGAQDSGVIGDLQAFVKFLMAQSDTLLWRLALDVNIQVPTGIVRQDAFRKVNGVTVSYFPYTTGAAALMPTLIFAMFFDQLMASFSAGYVSQNQSGEGLFNFNVLNDRIDLQLTADYMFKFTLAQDWVLYERPSLSLQYKVNLSQSPVFPDDLYVSLENYLKLNEDWRLRATFLMPVIAQPSISMYNIDVQLGKYF